MAQSNHINNIMVTSSTSSNFCYSDVSSTQTHLVSNISGFSPNPDIYSLTTGIEMIGFQQRVLPPTSSNNLLHQDPVVQGLWKLNHHHDHDHQNQNQNLMGSSEDQQEVSPFVDESCLRSSSTTCVFPCEGNERPSQGLSLSLSSSNPSTIALQSFQLKHHHNHDHDHHHQSRLMMGKSAAFPPIQEEVFLGKSVGDSTNSSLSMQFEFLRNSKYLAPVQELLNEFCSLGTKQTCLEFKRIKKNKNKNKEGCDLLDVDDHDDDDHLQNNMNGNSCTSFSRSLYGLNLLELQKRKTKLLGMLEELDRRYRHYYEQMKAVVSSFEVVAGPGSGNVYSALASKVMSRHFRCLRDAIVAQIKATKKAIGDKDVGAAVPGTSKGETPRLKMLDQAFRQHRALQQMTLIENHPWRPQRGLPERSVSVLRAWLFEHFLHPYPSDVDKHILARQTGLSRSQVSNWFINARVRLWKPMVEQMYQEETKEEQDNNIINPGSFSNIDHDHQTNEPCLTDTTTQPSSHDQKPTPNQLLSRIDPECLSSIVNTRPTTTNPSESHYGRNNNNIEAFGSVESLDFPSSSSYNPHHHQNHHHHGPAFGAHNDNSEPHQGFGGGGGGHVSLTLGLQQHGGNGGVTLAFSPTSQGSLFYGTRDHIDHHQYSLLDGDQTTQNLPYRNLMGAQLLHDFA